MTEERLIFVIIALCVIVGGLCFYQWRALAKKQQERWSQADAQSNETRKNLEEGLKTLLLCVIQDQINLSEAALRIKVHLDHLFPHEHQKNDLKIFYQFSDEVADFATHAKRNSLTTQERFNEDIAREKIEERLALDFKKACDTLYKKLA